jgi:hypothetical protein
MLVFIHPPAESHDSETVREYASARCRQVLRKTMVATPEGSTKSAAARHWKSRRLGEVCAIPVDRFPFSCFTCLKV